MNTTPMTCTTLDERLADYLEGDLAARERQRVDAHLASCLRCAALVRDLEQIRTDAGALDELTPSRDLWDGIAARIEAPVVPLPAAGVVAAPAVTVPIHTRRPAWASRARLAAVAAGLVAVTAGVTYTITAARYRDQQTVVAPPASVAPDSPARHDVALGAAESARSSDSTGLPGERSASQGSSSERPIPPTAPRDPERAAVAGGAAGSQNVANAGSADRNAGNGEATTYSREIERLREVFTQHKSRLDPRTAAILELNLKVIDEAIAQSRAALAQDPASGFLNDRLNSALEKKLELLRRAATLPART